MMVLVAALSTTTSTRTALEEQYYSQLAREAAEAGWVKAEACLAMTGTAQWAASGKTLRPETDCYGNTSITCPSTNSACYVAMNGNIRTSFSVGAAITGDYGKNAYTVNSVTELTRTGSPTTAWKAVNASVNYSTANVKTPRISGGAGWDAADHMGLVITADNQLYGYGANSAGQLNDEQSPTVVPIPVKINLPATVKSVKKVGTSGMGASALCIIGDNDKAYCRGDGILLTRGMWQQVMIPGDLPVRDMSISGYGLDAACFIAGTTTVTSQVYCFGSNEQGQLGDGTLTNRTAASPTKYVIPAGLYATSVEIQGVNSCVIANDGQAYCAGRNDYGQVANGLNGYNTAYLPKKFGIPPRGAVERKVKRVIMPHHLNELYYGGNIYVLTTDGFIFVAGHRVWGTAGNANTSGSTNGGLGEFFSINWSNYDFSATAGDIRYRPSSNNCMDVANNGTSNGTTIWLSTCSRNTAQRFVFTDEGKAIYHPYSGKCIDVPGNNGVNGQAIKLHTCNDSAAQRFSIRSDGRIRHDDSGRCIDNIGGSTTPGNIIGLWDCGTAYQTWNIDGRAMPWLDMISVGTATFCGVRNDTFSGVWCAGENGMGQMANVGTNLGGGVHGSQCPAGFDGLAYNMNLYSGGKIDISKLSSEWRYQTDTLQVIATDGNVYGGGNNTYGRLGNGTMAAKQCTTVKMNLPAGVKAIDMSTRDQYTTYILGSDGNVYAAGRNNQGQAGDGTLSHRSTPVVVRMPRAGAAY